MCTWCMHVSISMRLTTPMNGSPMRGPPHTRAHELRPCARACARVRSGAHTSAPAHASAFRRRGPRAARLAGVPVCVGVQREHRRVEHRVDNLVVLCMRRLFGPGGAPPQAGRARRVVGAHVRAPTCVGIAARTKDGIYVCMYTYMYIYVSISICMHYTYICR